MTDWGVHLIDMVLYGMKAGGPKSVVSMGGKFAYPNDAMQTPDTQQAIYEFDDFSMIWEHAVGINGGPFNVIMGLLLLKLRYIGSRQRQMGNIP
jgi:predicted dehydrogenase